MRKAILAAIGIMFILAGCMSEEEAIEADTIRALNRTDNGKPLQPVEYDKAKRNEF